MCRYCGNGDEAIQARHDAKDFADELEFLAAHYRAIYNRKELHNRMAEIGSNRAKRIIRRLVEEYL